MSKILRTFAPFALLVIALTVQSAVAAVEEEEGISPEKLAAYQAIQRDPTIRDLATRLDNEPQNQILMDNLLIQLQMSPLELFQIRMQANHHEYMVPKEIIQLHQRWLQFHPLSASGPELLTGNVQALTAILSLSPIPLLPSVGTNRDVAFAYSTVPTQYQGEVQVSVNRLDATKIVAGTNTWDAPAGCDQTQALFSSIDSGATWRYTCAPTFSAYSGLTCTGGNVKFGSDPAITWDDAGNVFAEYLLLCCSSSCQLGLANPKSAVVDAKSTNSGLTWSGNGVVSDHTGSGAQPFDDKEFYFIDNNAGSPFHGRHYTCWDLNNNEKAGRSTNGGVSWSQANIPDISGGADLGCNMAIQSNGTVHVVWDTLTGCSSTCTGEQTWYSNSTDGGQTWSSAVLVATHNLHGFGSGTTSKPLAQDNRGIGPFGAVGVDNTSVCPGTLYYAYSDYANGGNVNQSNIFVSRSTNGGATWTAGVQVNDDAAGSPNAQFHPFLAMDQTDGSIVVGWHDARNDAANKKIDFYVSRSTDCGVTWQPNIKTSQPSSEFNNNAISFTDENTADNANRNPNQFGEYMGVDANNRVAYLAWTDSRQFFPGSTANAQKENVGFSTVTFCSAPTGLSAPTATPGCVGALAKVDLSWSIPAAWGTNATGGTFSVERATSLAGPYSTLAAGLSGTTFTDSTAAPSTTYFYRITAKNNCPGTVLTPMTLTSGSTSVTTGICTSLPPVADGSASGAGGNPATFTKSGSNITATWDATTCTSANAVIEYGTIGNFSGYTAAADCSGGTAGTKTFTPPAGSVWFNIVWESGTTCGHPGYSSTGARTWSAVGTCTVAADDFTDGVCN